jgi:RNA polymerase sigma factor (sigma-70 family)
MVSVLTRIFGIENIALAEDVVQESLLEALQHWPYEAVPEDPSAWLFRVARNKALNILNRESYKRRYSSELAHCLKSEETIEPALNQLFTEKEILDDQLRMLFTCCHPAISVDSQIALALHTLCGFSIPEIARAFLSTEENIKKRLVRARQKIRDAHIPFEVPRGQDQENRLNTVLETLYLLFNEGYSASKGNDLIRYELCEEAIRLTGIIAAQEINTSKGNVFALLSLMFLNASRFNARQDQEGNLLTLAEQDRSLWDAKLKDTGLSYLKEATKTNTLSNYHILSAISAQYCIAEDYESTDWKSILALYDHLAQIDCSPVILLNRAIALSKVGGPEKGLAELEQLKNLASFKTYQLFYSTQAELYTQIGEFENAANSLNQAIQFASLDAEKDLLRKKLYLLVKK